MMQIREKTAIFDAYLLDGTIEAFETTANALSGRLGRTYPENEMVLVILNQAAGNTLECKTGDYVVDFGGVCGKFSEAEFNARFYVLPEE